MSHGHAPFVILSVTLEREKVTRPNAAIGAPFHAHADANFGHSLDGSFLHGILHCERECTRPVSKVTKTKPLM